MGFEALHGEVPIYDLVDGMTMCGVSFQYLKVSRIPKSIPSGSIEYI